MKKKKEKKVQVREQLGHSLVAEEGDGPVVKPRLPAEKAELDPDAAEGFTGRATEADEFDEDIHHGGGNKVGMRRSRQVEQTRGGMPYTREKS